MLRCARLWGFYPEVSGNNLLLIDNCSGQLYICSNMGPITTRLSDVLSYLDSERRRRRLRLADIAEAAGYADASAAKRALESPNPTLQNVLRLADAMGVTLSVTAGQGRNPVRIAIYNHAGGTSKTTLVRDTGVRMAQLGLNVLLIDLDPQANLTDWLGIDSTAIELDETVYPALVPTDGRLGGNLKALPAPRRTFGVDLIPSCLDLVMLESALYQQMGAGPTRLRNALSTLETASDYDVVIIDPPPYVSQVSNLAVLAVDHVVVPVSTTAKAIDGIPRVHAIVDSLKEQNQSLRVTAIVPTQYDARVGAHREALEALPDLAGSVPVLSPIRYLPGPHSTAQLEREPIPERRDRSWAEAQLDVDRVTGDLLGLLGVNVSVQE